MQDLGRLRLALVLRRWTSLKGCQVVEESWWRLRACLPLRGTAFTLDCCFTLNFSLHHLLLHLSIDGLLTGWHSQQELLSSLRLRCGFGTLH